VKLRFARCLGPVCVVQPTERAGDGVLILIKALDAGMAIAFGLGGRHLARRLLESLLGQKEKAKHEEPRPL